ncbi:Dabb family protein [Aquirufa sp. ROCK2-A2]
MNLPIRHAGLLNFKSTVSEQTKFDFFLALKALAEIPGVENLEISKQISSKNQYEYGFSMVFESQEIYDAYSCHPKHDTFVQTWWIPNVEEFMEIDTVVF